MTPEGRFLLIAVLVVGIFAIKLLFGNAATRGMAAEWRDDKDSGLFATFRQFFLSLGLTVQPLLVLTALVLLSLAVFLVFMELFPDSWLAPPIAALAFLLACLGVMRDYAQWQAKRFEERLIDAIDIMVAALNVGENTVKALETTADSTRGKISAEFREIVKRLDLGLEIDQAVQHMVGTYDSEGVRLFTQSLRAKWLVGGDLAVVLLSVNRIIRERAKLRMQMGGQLSGVRYASLFLAFMPYLLYGFFLWSQPGWVAMIHEHPSGSKLIYGALALQVLGLLWLLRILKSEL